MSSRDQDSPRSFSLPDSLQQARNLPLAEPQLRPGFSLFPMPLLDFVQYPQPVSLWLSPRDPLLFDRAPLRKADISTLHKPDLLTLLRQGKAPTFDLPWRET